MEEIGRHIEIDGWEGGMKEISYWGILDFLQDLVSSVKIEINQTPQFVGIHTRYTRVHHILSNT